MALMGHDRRWGQRVGQGTKAPALGTSMKCEEQVEKRALVSQGLGVARLLVTSFLLGPVRDRVRTKMERDILADVNHPFVVKLHYGETADPT